MTRQEKIDAIYKEIANKTLSIGCIVKRTCDSFPILDTGVIIQSSHESFPILYGHTEIEHYIEHATKSEIQEIIGNPVMLGDAIEYYMNLPKAKVYTNNIIVIVNSRKKLREPIEEQDDECIDFIYGLLC